MAKSKSKRYGPKNYILPMIGIVLAFIAVAVGFSLLTHREATPDSAPIATAETAEPTPEPSAPATEETASADFVLLDSAEPTLQGHNGYFTQEENGEKIWERDKRFADEWCTDDTAVEGLKTFLGNQVYAVPTSAIVGAENVDPSNDETVYIQLYGYSPNVVDADGYVRNTSIWMRQEFTGKRIYVFETNEELEDAQKAWDNGQAILNGEVSDENALIVNGRLVTGANVQNVDGEWYIPLLYVASVVNPDLYVNNTDAQTLTIPLQGTYAGATITVPYALRGVGSQATTDTFEAGNYNSNLGEGTSNEVYWTDTFRAGDGNACYVPASELSRYTGWYIYTNGNAIHVVTDETDVSDLFVLDTRGNRTAENQIGDDGDTIIKYTDPFDPTLHDMMEEDGVIDEDGNFVEDYQESLNVGNDHEEADAP